MNVWMFSPIFLILQEMINLDKHIEILLLSNDCVIVPDFGGFMAHHTDARKDEDDGSFLPPIRSLGFNPKLTLNDSLLAQSYVEAYDISYPDAVMRIEDEVRELKQRISADGKYDFSGIGVIRLNDDGYYEFTPCEAGVISPELYGLGSFRMKTIKEIKASMQPALSIAINEEESLREETGADDRLQRHTARTIAMWRNIAVASIAVIFFLLIPSPLVNSTQMAGNHINTALLDRVMPKDITTGQDKVELAVKSQESINAVKELAKAEVKESKSEVKKTAPAKEGFSLVIASRVTLNNANAYVKDLRSRGYTDAFVQQGTHVKVLLGHYPTRAEASNALSSLTDKQEFAGAWITDVKF